MSAIINGSADSTFSNGININSGKFTVDASTGAVSSAAGMTLAGAVSGITSLGCTSLVSSGAISGTTGSFTLTQDAQTITSVTNASAGTTAIAVLKASNGTSIGTLQQYGTGFTTSGVQRQNGTLVYADGVGGLTLATGINQPIYIAVNLAQVASFTSTGLAVTGTLDVAGIASTAGVWNKTHTWLGASNATNASISQGSIGTGTITHYIGTQSINTSSDVRLKENIKPTERSGLALLNQWEIIDHTWNDPSDQCENNRNSRGVWTGVIAQQAHTITPWLVNKPTDDVDAEGNPQYWFMDYGYAVPLVVKAIQELAAKVAALEGASK